jgi:diguanylate cyclase (GGDEF)-like protein
MDSKSLINVAVSEGGAEGIHAAIRKLDRRERWLWSSAVAVTLLLMIGIGSFTFPALLSDTTDSYAFFLNQAVRGLVGLVLIFNVYLVYQQVQISRLRRQVTDQVFAVDKVEVLTQEVYKLAILDSATGLVNRRYVEQRLSDELKRAGRTGRPLSIILIDLDRFKQVNDSEGHSAGDVVLKGFAEALSKATRGSDIVARYGGDEFLVVLPECRPEEVQYVLNRLQNISVEVNGRKIAVPYSSGTTNYIPGETVDELFKRADESLYQHKRATAEPASPICQPS